MSCKKDYELLKKEVEYIESCEMTCEPGCNNAFKNIYECAERMATEIKREGKVSVELFDHVKELEAQLKTVEGREANLQEELGNAVAKIHELEVSRDEWKKQWELEVSGRRLAEKEVAKLKDGYKVALELVETAKPITCSECEHFSDYSPTYKYCHRNDIRNISETDFCSRAVRKEAPDGK